MTEDAKLPPIYLLVKQIEGDGFQFSIGSNKEGVKARMETDGFRAFELGNERSIEDMSS